MSHKLPVICSIRHANQSTSLCPIPSHEEQFVHLIFHLPGIPEIHCGVLDLDKLYISTIRHEVGPKLIQDHVHIRLAKLEILVGLRERCPNQVCNGRK